MIYKEFKPCKELSPYIQLIWILESENDKDKENEVYPKQKILPDGIVEIIFHYKQPFIITNANGITQKQPKSFAVSQMREYIEIESDGIIGFVSIRFFPWGAQHFFNHPIQTFLDETIDLKSIWKNEYQTILQKIKQVENEQKITIIQNFLIQCLNKYQKKDFEIDKVIKLIRTKKGQLSIEQICKQTNFSPKQLQRKFLAATGTTPKVFSCTTRFLYLCHHLKEYENKTFTELAQDMGYYDQSHFIKDFKKFTGMKPKDYFSKNNICFANL